MRKRVMFIQILVFSICIIAATILLMVPHGRHRMDGSDIITKKEYGWPLAWRAVTPAKNGDVLPTVNVGEDSLVDSEKLILNLLIFGSITTVLLLATSTLERRQ